MYKRKYSNKWVEHNKKEYGVQIVELKKIINNQVIACGKSDEFTSDMLVALVSGRKITEKIPDTDWTDGYRANTYRFLNSLIEQAKSRKSLSKKQMEAASNIYLRVKKNIEKNKKKA